MILNADKLFISTYNQRIHREGSQELLNHLQKETTFFEDPASTKYHLDYPGGLVEHSMNVFYRLDWLCNHEPSFHCNSNVHFDTESIAIVSLLHDLCKCGTYKKEYETCVNYNISSTLDDTETFIDNNGMSYFLDKKIRYTKDDKFPFGHGEKSVYMITQYMKLTDEEALAIRYHMGSWNSEEMQDAGSVFRNNTLAFLLHVADEYSTFVDEVKK